MSIALMANFTRNKLMSLFYSSLHCKKKQEFYRVCHLSEKTGTLMVDLLGLIVI